MMASRTANGLSFAALCAVHGVPRPVAEYRFAEARGRRWRFDFAWPEARLALEVDGGGWQRGRHHHHDGFMEDCTKLNTAVVLGWRVLRVTPEQVRDGAAFEFVREALGVPARAR